MELLKHGLIADQNLFSKLEQICHGGFNNPELLATFIRRSIELKLQIINEDWFEKQQQGDRIYLNLGHTFGHAFEYLERPKLLHGEAVAMGIGLSYKIANHLGVCSSNDIKHVESHFNQLKIKTSPQDLLSIFSTAQVIEKIMVDKKKQDSLIKFILPKGIGQGCQIQNFTPQELEDFLRL